MLPMRAAAGVCSQRLACGTVPSQVAAWGAVGACMRSQRLACGTVPSQVDAWGAVGGVRPVARDMRGAKVTCAGVSNCVLVQAQLRDAQLQKAAIWRSCLMRQA